MFERFTDEAKRAIVLAQEESRLLHHDYIGSEHLLLGLLHDQVGTSAAALASLSVGIEPARTAIADRVGRGDGSSPSHIPFTPQAKSTLEQSLREALRLSHDHIGSEHLLLGLVADPDRLACRILTELGAPPESTRERVLVLLARPVVDAPDPPLVVLLGSGGPDLVGLGDRFTATARQAFTLALALASRSLASHTDVDHLLLGLIGREESFATFLIRAAGTDPVALRAALPGSEPQALRPLLPPPTGSGWPLTPNLSTASPAAAPPATADLADALRLAATEADRLDDSTVSTGHLLLGISGTSSSTAGVLHTAGLSTGVLRRLLSRPDPST